MNKLKFELASPVLMWLLIFAGSLLIWRLAGQGLVFGSSWWQKALLGLGLLNWLYLIAVSMKVHRQAGRSVARVDRLVTEGIYATVRHPIYLADITLAWCVFVALPHYWIFGAAAWLTLVMVFWANLEERMLEEKFLEDYRAYKQQVPMFVPRLKK